MNKATSTFIAAAAALALSGGAYAQANNTLATPTVKSPADTSSGYGTTAVSNSDSGTGAASPNSTSTNATAATGSYGANNTLATPTVKSPVSGQ